MKYCKCGKKVPKDRTKYCSEKCYKLSFYDKCRCGRKKWESAELCRKCFKKNSRHRR